MPAVTADPPTARLLTLGHALRSRLPGRPQPDRAVQRRWEVLAPVWMPYTADVRKQAFRVVPLVASDALAWPVDETLEVRLPLSALADAAARPELQVDVSLIVCDQVFLMLNASADEHLIYAETLRCVRAPGTPNRRPYRLLSRHVPVRVVSDQEGCDLLASVSSSSKAS
jgi:hypothetical protein